MAENSTLRDDRDRDSDIMGTVKGLLVTEDNYLTLRDYRDDITHISIIRNKRYPGYCKLQLSQACYDILLKNCGTFRKNSQANCDQIGVVRSVVKQQEKMLISSKLFNENVGTLGLIQPDKLDEPLFRQNGPAKRNASVDYVRCFEFITWPQEAKKWKERQRKRNWPSRNVLDRLEKEVSCYVVPTGNKSSEEFDLEWRVSFVEIERELIWNMNDTQFKCYICLKRLKKSYMNEKCNVFENISTYQIKNIMFWMCEEIPKTNWKKQDLLPNVLLGLRKLRDCILKRRNEHYMIRGNNLWQNVVLAKTERKKALQFLKSLITRSDIIKTVIILPENLKFSSASPKVFAYFRRCTILLDWGSKCSEKAKLEMFYQNLFEKFPETDICSPCKEITMAKLRWFTFLKPTCAYRMSGIDEEDVPESIIKDVIDQMKSGNNIDYLTCSLNIAMVYFVHGQYSEVLKELKSKLSSLPCKYYVTHYNHLLRVCLGTDGLYHFDDRSCDLSDLPTQRQNLIFDFDVLWTERAFLPFPLKLQRYLFGQSLEIYLVNPFVIGCYLLVLSEHKLGHTSEMKSKQKLLVSAVSDKYNNFHRCHYFHLYLIGHSYYVTGDMKTAYKWFALSAVTKPSLRNAAIYHIAIMINDNVRTRAVFKRR